MDKVDNSKKLVEFWKAELEKQLKTDFAKKIVNVSHEHIDDIEKMIDCADASAIMAFIYFVMNMVKQDKVKILQNTAHSIVGGLCLTMLPIIGNDEFDLIMGKYREMLYQEIMFCLNRNLSLASEELTNKYGNDTGFASTTIH